jgi:hypothetical protein
VVVLKFPKAYPRTCRLTAYRNDALWNGGVYRLFYNCFSGYSGNLLFGVKGIKNGRTNKNGEEKCYRINAYAKE